MGFLKALGLISDKKTRKPVKKKVKTTISKKKTVKKTKTVKKNLKTTKKTTKKSVKKPMKKKPVKKMVVKKKKPVIKKLIKKKLVVKKKIVKKKSVKNIVKKKKTVKKKAKPKKRAKKKIPPKPKVELIEEKLPKKRALKLIAEPEVVEFMMETAGEDGYAIYKFLVTFGKEIDEYTLADKVELQINYARSLLYKLYDHKLVSFFRERDKKKGWFIYSWNAHPEKLKYILIRAKEEKIVRFQKEMLKQQDSFHCDNCDKNYEYTQAIENMFFCSNCGNQLQAIKVSEIREKIEKEISALKKEIAELKKI